MTKRLIDLLREDYAARRRKVVVLGQEIYVMPLTLGEQMKIGKMHPDDDALRIIETLIAKAVDADGNKVFSRDDKQELKRAVAGDELLQIMAAMNGPSAEQQLKNSEGDDQ